MIGFTRAFPAEDPGIGGLVYPSTPFETTSPPRSPESGPVQYVLRLGRLSWVRWGGANACSDVSEWRGSIAPIRQAGSDMVRDTNPTGGRAAALLAAIDLATRHAGPAAGINREQGVRASSFSRASIPSPDSTSELRATQHRHAVSDLHGRCRIRSVSSPTWPVPCGVGDRNRDEATRGP
jgi:hypothetical protein